MPSKLQPVEAAAPAMGPVETGVREQVAASKRAADLPAIVAAAIKLAQLIDDDDFAGQAAGNLIKLQKLLAELQSPKRKSGGRLAVVSAMSRRVVAQ